jgi:acetoin utilization protein AcuB
MPEEFFVRDYMTSPATALQQTNSLLDAALLLRRTGFRHLPIVDGERLVGIITDRDVSRLSPSLLGKVSQKEYNAIFQNTPLEKVMTRNPIAVTPDMQVLEAVTILHNRKLGCLPVVENDRLAGIITITDMLGLLFRLLGGKAATGFGLEGA